MKQTFSHSEKFLNHCSGRLLVGICVFKICPYRRGLSHIDYRDRDDASTIHVGTSLSAPVIRVKKPLVVLAAITMHDFISKFHQLKGVCDSFSPYLSMFGIIWEMGLSSMQKSWL